MAPQDAIRPEVADAQAQLEAVWHQGDDPHLRSFRAVIDYRIPATGGAIGHVSDLLVEEETWAIRYLVVTTGHWWFGYKVVIPPQ